MNAWREIVLTPERSEPCCVFVVDDHPGVREGLAMLLERRGIVVCGEAEDAEQTLSHLESVRPDVVLVDLSLHRGNGVELIGQLHVRGECVLVYSMHEDATHVKQAFAAGASGYVTKREGATTLTQAIREVAAGRRYLSERIRETLVDGWQARAGGDGEPCNLSNRETVVLKGLGEGDCHEDIGRRLHISPRTVETYCARILEKLGLAGMKELRRYAIQLARKGAGGADLLPPST
jgi:DNA-binding NarL/FixJ family response regulator